MVSVDSQGNPSFDLRSIPSISDIRDRGRRQMDKDNLKRQTQEEDARSSRLRREKLTLERVKEMAKQLTPTNDKTYVSAPQVVRWRILDPEMVRNKYWEDMSRSGQLDQTLWNARKCMPFLDKYSGYSGAEYKEQLTTKTKVIDTF